MKKKNYKGTKNRRKGREDLFLIILVIAFVVLIAAAAIQRLTADDSVNYVITAEGHVHAADGTHIGTVDELFGSEGSVVVTEDGHLHAEDGSHIGTVNETDETNETVEESAAE